MFKKKKKATPEEVEEFNRQNAELTRDMQKLSADIKDHNKRMDEKKAEIEEKAAELLEWINEMSPEEHEQFLKDIKPEVEASTKEFRSLIEKLNKSYYTE